MNPHSRRQAPIKREELRAEHIGQHHISRIINREIMPKCPDRLDQIDMRIFGHLQISQIIQPGHRPILPNFPTRGKAAYDMGYFEIQKMRRVK